MTFNQEKYTDEITKKVIGRLLALPRHTLELLGKEAGISDEAIAHALDSREKNNPTVDEILIRIKHREITNET